MKRHPDDNMIGERVQARRENLGVSQRSLARKTGINLWRIEHGYRTPTVETLKKLGEALDVDYRDFLED